MTQTYDKNFGVRNTPALPENWSNLLAIWEERGKDIKAAAELNKGGRYAVVWSGYDLASTAYGLLKKLSALAIQLSLIHI